MIYYPKLSPYLTTLFVQQKPTKVTALQGTNSNVSQASLSGNEGRSGKGQNSHAVMVYL